jgi:hypothetical protein
MTLVPSLSIDRRLGDLRACNTGRLGRLRSTTIPIFAFGTQTRNDCGAS